MAKYNEKAREKRVQSQCGGSYWVKKGGKPVDTKKGGAGGKKK